MSNTQSDDPTEPSASPAPAEPPAPAATEAPEAPEAPAATPIPDGGDGGDGPAPGRAKIPPAMMAVTGVLGLLVLILLAVVLGREVADRSGDGGDGGTGTTAPTSPATTTGTIPKDFRDWEDPVAGFTMRFPTDWAVLKGDDAASTPLEGEGNDLRLVLRVGDLHAVQVRVNELAAAVGPDNLGDLKAVTDAIIQDADITMLDQRQVTINGMQGYLYLYTFRDSESNQEGVHAHYFLFKGKKMNSIVFQAIPSDAFGRLEATFDEVRDSFESQG